MVYFIDSIVAGDRYLEIIATHTITRLHINFDNFVNFNLIYDSTLLHYVIAVLDFLNKVLNDKALLIGCQASIEVPVRTSCLCPLLKQEDKTKKFVKN